MANLLIPRVSEQVRKNLSSEEEMSPPKDTSPSEPDQSIEDDMLEKITVIAYDEDQRIPRLLDYIKQLSDEGYSFRIIVDPEHEETMKAFHWEGEGIDEIISVDTEEISQSEIAETEITEETRPSEETKPSSSRI